MQIFEIFLIGIGLSMDAFAVAICKGLAMPKVKKTHALLIALFFGGFQAGMPFLGWLLGRQFQAYIVQVDHWVAFVLLLIIGGKMVKESFEKEEFDACPAPYAVDLKELTLLALATSIDALAVGVTFAFMNVQILPAVTIIGVTTLALSYLGVFIGNWFGVKYKNKAELFGGVVLIGIGLKILLEGLGVL